MSGGSHNYFCNKLSDLRSFSEIDRRDFAYLIQRLKDSGAPDVADEVEALLAFRDQLESALIEISEVMQPILMAREWVDSCDWSEEDFQKELLKFRADKEKALGNDNSERPT